MEPRTNSKTKKTSRPRKPLSTINTVKMEKITKYFPPVIPRPQRKTPKQIENEQFITLQEALNSTENEDSLEVFVCSIKGRSIRATASYSRNEFVVEYKGDLISHEVAKKREKSYFEDPNIGSYMFFFSHKNKKWCIDATAESPFKGRLINHSALKPNLKTKVVEIDNIPRLILLAKREILIGEELLYDYGDRNSASIAHSPWLINT